MAISTSINGPHPDKSEISVAEPKGTVTVVRELRSNSFLIAWVISALKRLSFTISVVIPVTVLSDEKLTHTISE